MTNTIRFYLECALALALLTSLGATWYYNNKYDSEHAKFELFKITTQVLGDQAKKDKKNKETEWEIIVTELEKRYAQDNSANRARFNRELDKLRAIPSKGDSGSGGMSSSPFAPSVCSDEAGNNGLSIALRSFEIGIIQLLAEAQNSTDSLIACQSYVQGVR